jgi:hypothetical protein
MVSARGILVFALAVPLLFVFIIEAGAQDANGAFAQLQKVVEQLSDLARTQPSTFETSKIVDLKQKIDRLHIEMGAASPGPAAAYVRVLWYQADLLAQAAATSSTTEARSIIDDVSADLNAKLTSSSAAGTEPSRRGMINVTVRTKRGDTEVMGYLINCSPLRYRDAEPMFSFPTLSSPTTHELPPGKFELAAVQNGLVVSRRIVDIFLAGQDPVLIDIPVP